MAEREDHPDVTTLLHAVGTGDKEAEIHLFEMVYDELRHMAAPLMFAQPPNHTLQPTALVHESFLRLIKGGTLGSARSRGYFFGAAAQAMRQVLVEHARAKKAAKRGGTAERVPLDEALETALSELAAQKIDMLALDAALVDLARIDPRKHDVVSLRFFGGLTNAEIAECLEVSLRTVEKEAKAAKAWLRAVLSE